MKKDFGGAGENNLSVDGWTGFLSGGVRGTKNKHTKKQPQHQDLTCKVNVSNRTVLCRVKFSNTACTTTKNNSLQRFSFGWHVWHQKIGRRDIQHHGVLD